jgi:hypothetical protein
MLSIHVIYLTDLTHHKAARIPGPEFTPVIFAGLFRGTLVDCQRDCCSSGYRAHSANARLAAAQDGRRPWLSGLSVDRGDDDVDGHSSLGHHRRADWRMSAGLWVEVRHGCSKSAGGDVSPAPRTGNPGLVECSQPGKRRCRPLMMAWRDHGIQEALESSATYGFARSPWQTSRSESTVRNPAQCRGHDRGNMSGLSDSADVTSSEGQGVGGVGG